jgi:Zn-dependent peptidase ImmA (M78 family)
VMLPQANSFRWSKRSQLPHVRQLLERQQEDEADWVAGTLLLPRVALLTIGQQGVNYTEHAREYGVSEYMLRMRLDRTRVSLQMRRRAR